MNATKIEIAGKRIPLYAINTLIIGSGAAALNAAINLYKFGQKNIAIATDLWGGGTSNNAGSDKQTYYKLSVAGDTPDSPQEMAQDLFNGGCMHGDIALCEATSSARAFFNLVSLGVPFPHDRHGDYVGYKTDHDPRGRATSAGPLTSHLMFKALAEEVREKGIEVFDRTNDADIIIFVMDTSETCGYSLEKQKNLLKNLKDLFSKSEFIIVENKSDLSKKNLDYLKISCKTGQGIDVLKEKIFLSYESLEKNENN